jgi:hypothetical protein
MRCENEHPIDHRRERKAITIPEGVRTAGIICLHLCFLTRWTAKKWLQMCARDQQYGSLRSDWFCAVRGDPVLQLMAFACAGDEFLGWFRCRSLWFESNICYFPSSKDGNYNSFFIIKKMLLQHLQYEFFFHVSTSINFEYYFVSIKCHNYSLIALQPQFQSQSDTRWAQCSVALHDLVCYLYLYPIYDPY